MINKKILLAICVNFIFSSIIFSFERNYSKIQNEQKSASGEHFIFRDVFGTEFETVINPNVLRSVLKKENFKLKNKKMTYSNDLKYKVRLGVDISRHDGKVNWKKLKSRGIEFVILRIGYRGYQSGKLFVDQNFHQNIKGAQKAGLDVGVYIFSQSISEEETLQEINLVLEELKNYKINLPVFFDPETIRDDQARSDNVSGEQFTKNAILFCQKIKEAGYISGIYSNMLWQAYEFDLSKLNDFVMWYADYEEQPQTPYRFEFWQYAEKGGKINAPYDLNIQVIPVE